MKTFNNPSTNTAVLAQHPHTGQTTTNASSLGWTTGTVDLIASLCRSAAAS